MRTSRTAAILIAMSIGCTHALSPRPPALHVGVTPGTYRSRSEVHNGAFGFDRHEVELALAVDGTARVIRTSVSVYAAANDTEHDVNDRASTEMTGTWTRDGDAIVVHLESDRSTGREPQRWELRCRATATDLMCDFPPPAARALVLHGPENAGDGE